jgi:hypothetical protein
MKYQEVETLNPDGSKELHIVTDNGNSFTSFPADNSNPNYLAFLAALQKENPDDPHFVAWVEAGNDPDEFWSQEVDTIE